MKIPAELHGLARRALSPLPAIYGCFFLLMGTATNPVHAVDESQPPVVRGSNPRPQEAIKAILAAFDKYEIVGMPEAHGNKDLDDFILALIRHPDFARKVNDIEVECGNSLYQPLLDRYLQGEEVSLQEVSQVWRNTTQPMCGQSGFFAQLFPLVRQINSKLPQGKKLRILAGEPPIDWSQVKTAADLNQYMPKRDQNYAEVVKKEVLAKHRKALLLFGTAHLRRAGLLVSAIEKERPGASFMITDYRGFYSGTVRVKYHDELEARIASWPVPSLAVLKGTWLGELSPDALIRPLGFFGGCGAQRPDQVAEKLSQTIDAVLYLGPRDLQLHELRPAHVFLDKDYMAELQRRAGIQGGGGMRSAGAVAEDTVEGVLEYDPNPILYNAVKEDNYVKLLEKMNAEAKKRCAPSAAGSRQSPPPGMMQRTVPPPPEASAPSSPGQNSQPGGWNPPRDIPAGGIFQQTVPPQGK